MLHFTRPGHKGRLFLFAALALLFAAALPARAASVTYLDATGQPQTVDATPLDGSESTLTSGWYVCQSGALTYGATLAISGDVHLILADGCVMTTAGSFNRAGIAVNDGNALTIYSQSAGSGKLTATGGNYGAGIGGDFLASSVGAITITGGTVTATGGSSGAGIGGGRLGAGGDIAIGGNADVTATGGDGSGPDSGGAGIGSGGTTDGTPVTAGAISISTSGSVNATGGGAGTTGGKGADMGQGGYNGGDGADAVFHDITATAGAGGAITPATAQSTVGGRVMFTITPDPGYVLDTLTLDGADVKGSVGAGGVLVVIGTAANQAVAASFKLGASAAASVPALDPKALLMLVLLLVGVGGAMVAKVTTRRAR